MTDGSGTLSFTSISSGASNVTGLSDALVEDNSVYIGNDPSSTTSSAQYNLAVGTTALDAVTTGDDNIAVGYNAGTNIADGTKNIAIGTEALETLTNRYGNVAIGYQALQSATTSGNVAIGREAMKSLNSDGTENGSQNVAIGQYAVSYTHLTLPTTMLV